MYKKKWRSSSYTYAYIGVKIDRVVSVVECVKANQKKRRERIDTRTLWSREKTEKKAGALMATRFIDRRTMIQDPNNILIEVLLNNSNSN